MDSNACLTSETLYSALGTLEILLKRKKQLEPPPDLPLYKSSVPSPLCQKITAKAEESINRIKSFFKAQHASEIASIIVKSELHNRFPLSFNAFSEADSFTQEVSTENLVKTNEIANIALQLQNCLLSQESHRFVLQLLNLLFKRINEGKERLSKFLGRIEVVMDPIKNHFSIGIRPLPKNLVDWLDDLARDLVICLFFNESSNDLTAQLKLLPVSTEIPNY